MVRHGGYLRAIADYIEVSRTAAEDADLTRGGSCAPT